MKQRTTSAIVAGGLIITALLIVPSVVFADASKAAERRVPVAS